MNANKKNGRYPQRRALDIPFKGLCFAQSVFSLPVYTQAYCVLYVYKRAAISRALASKPRGLKAWPAHERPREKLLERGASYLSDAELLALLLRSGSAQQGVLELARELLQHFGGLGALLHADIKQLQAFNGLGPAKISLLKAITELAQRQLAESLVQKPQLTSSRDAAEYLRLRYQHIKREIFSCLFLDNQHGLIASEELFMGSIDHSHVYIRELIKRCLTHGAAAIIVAHNHPSGNSEPSRADIQITQRLKEATQLFDIRLLDHLVVGQQVSSMADLGLM